MFRKTDCEGFHRRDFLQVGSIGMLGLSLPAALRAAPARPGKSTKAKSVILVWLPGGPATIDMWDNKPEAPEGIRGEFKSISTKGDFQLAEHLPKMAAIGDKYSVVRSLHHTIPSHAPATVFMTTGNKPTASIQYPSYGSLCSKLLSTPKGVPPYVVFSQLRNGAAGLGGYLGTSYNPFTVEGGNGRGGAKSMSVRGISLPNGFTIEDLDKRDQLLSGLDKKFQELDKNADVANGLDSFHQQALDILRSDETKKAFDLTKESKSVIESYGNTPLATSALAARRLVEAGVRFVTLTTGGWDTHSNNFTNLKTKLLPPLDQTLSALIADLDQRGLLDSTIVMCAGEFGRTPKVNAKSGRDHWARSMACVIAGGGFNRGYAHGTTDASGMAPATEPVTPDDLGATIFHQLGIDPHSELNTSTGRPMQLFREGTIVNKLIS
ncbi:MAG: DUF1501 domain-containing protein [Zavarzinella sp.]